MLKKIYKIKKDGALMLRLCSKSESRANILKNVNIDFFQCAVDFDEDSIKATNARAYVYNVVKGKLKSALDEFGLKDTLLVADSVIECQGEILRKAKDLNNAKEILNKISGSEIKIITASILKNEILEFINLSSTTYIFEKFDKSDLEKYINSNEWQGKAGACMVEGFCKKYIKKVVGLESNAMGLPIEKIKPWLDF